MIPYASRTGTKCNLAALERADWRLLLSARGSHAHNGFPYAIDNGAWTAHTHNEPFDVPAFEQILRTHSSGADWIVPPDIVGGGLRSLELSLSWLARCQSACARTLVAVQDGMVPADLLGIVGPRTGIFVGGSTEWKLSSLPQWGAFAAQHELWLHIARVNSAPRIRLCAQHGATSFDGSGPSRFAFALPLLDRTVRECRLLYPGRMIRLDYPVSACSDQNATDAARSRSGSDGSSSSRGASGPPNAV